MTTHTTFTSAKAWAPDQRIDGRMLLREAPKPLALQIGTVVGTIAGDEPAIRIPLVTDDGTAAFVPEGEQIPGGGGRLDEAIIQTRMVATMNMFSIDALAQSGNAESALTAMGRRVVAHADRAFVASDAEPYGLLHDPALTTDGGAVDGSLDALVDGVTTIEAAGGQPTHVLAAPDAWAALSKLKAATGSNMPLLGGGTAATERAVLGLPVVTSSAVPSGQLLVLDRGAILVAAPEGPTVESSRDFAFDYYAIAARATFRFGWKVARPDHVVKLTTTAPAA